MNPKRTLRPKSRVFALRTRGRSGFTLLEMVLVLTIIVAVAAMAAPMFQGTMKTERLRKGVELVAADWVSTRATAMETGQPQVWVCQIGSSGYSSSTYSNNSGLSPTEATAAVVNTTGLSATESSASGGGDFGQSMPSGVSISEVLVSEGDSILTMSQMTNSDLGNATIFFYPDGTSSSARLSVSDEEQRTMTVVMNGMAGTVRVLKEIGGAQQ